MKLEYSRQIFEKSSNIAFDQNPSSDSRVVPLKTAGRFSQKRLKGGINITHTAW